MTTFPSKILGPKLNKTCPKCNIVGRCVQVARRASKTDNINGSIKIYEYTDRYICKACNEQFFEIIEGPDIHDSER